MCVLTSTHPSCRVAELSFSFSVFVNSSMGYRAFHLGPGSRKTLSEKYMSSGQLHAPDNSYAHALSLRGFFF